MEHSIQVFAAIGFLVIGLSHLIRPLAWVGFFQALAARGTTGAFLEGLLTLSFGSLIVAFHNVWQGPAVVLTLIGWAQVLKGAGRLVFPEVAVRIYARVTVDRAWQFRVAGAAAILLSGFLWWVRLAR